MLCALLLTVNDVFQDPRWGMSGQTGIRLSLLGLLAKIKV